MSKSWTSILCDKKQPPTKGTTHIKKKTEIEEGEYDTENCEIEKRFMDYYGYKTTLLWEKLLDSIGNSPLLSKPKSSSKLHDFLYNNIDLDLTKIGIHDEDSTESTEEFIE
tara:strand:- start:675 stop:1007 length:333 start_codon:yes stop_codon:yes gene_type:complete